MCNKILAIVALLGAPFLCIDFLDNEGTNESWTTGLYGLIYMTGWMASVIGLYRVNAAGTHPAGKIILLIQFILIAVAQVFNLDVLLHGGNNGIVQRSLDPFWPASNGFMLATGISVLSAKRLKGWHSWIPLVVGAWLPILLASRAFGFRSLYFAGFYSAVAWTLLAIVIYTSDQECSKKAIVTQMRRQAVQS
jgi:hypothetical protein